MRGALSLAGFALGAYLGARLAPTLLQDGSPYAPLVALGAALLAGTFLSSLAELLGVTLRSTLGAIPGLRALDSAGGLPARRGRGDRPLLGRRRGAPLPPGPVAAARRRAGVGDPRRDQRRVPARAPARDARAGRSDRGARRPAGGGAPAGHEAHAGSRRGPGVAKRRPRLGGGLRPRGRGVGLDRAPRLRRDECPRGRRRREPPCRPSQRGGLRVLGHGDRHQERPRGAARTRSPGEAAAGRRPRARRPRRAHRLPRERRAPADSGSHRWDELLHQSRCLRRRAGDEDGDGAARRRPARALRRARRGRGGPRADDGFRAAARRERRLRNSARPAGEVLSRATAGGAAVISDCAR